MSFWPRHSQGLCVVSAVQVHVRLRVDALHEARDVHQVGPVPHVAEAHLPRRGWKEAAGSASQADRHAR